MGMDKLASGLMRSARDRTLGRQTFKEEELAKEPQKGWPKAGDPGEHCVMEAQGGKV